jgi:ABC-type sulfate transport system substrate-binding protein
LNSSTRRRGRRSPPSIISAHRRPRPPRATPDRFPKLELLTIADFGGWAAAQKAHFAEGGVFDQIYRPGS